MEVNATAGMLRDRAFLTIAGIDELVDKAADAYAKHPDAPKSYASALHVTAKEKARRAAERLYKPGEIVVDSRGVEYACCNDGSLRLAGGNLKLRKKERVKLRRRLKAIGALP